jgi:hypothetical protein
VRELNDRQPEPPYFPRDGVIPMPKYSDFGPSMSDEDCPARHGLARIAGPCVAAGASAFSRSEDENRWSAVLVSSLAFNSTAQ